jgi:hypothetical protein
MSERVGMASMIVVVLMAGGPAVAQQMFVFPQQGQDQAQQDVDRGACHVWAVNQTGFDPTMASTTPPRSNEASQGGLVRGGAFGAAGGAAIGAIAGNAGRGAAMGAVGGGLIGGMRRSNQRNRQNQGQRNWQAEQDTQRAEYRRALTACLEGKGYTVG